MSQQGSSLAKQLVLPLFLGFVFLCIGVYIILSVSSKLYLERQIKVRALDVAESFTVAVETKATRSNMIRVINSLGSYQDIDFVALVNVDNLTVIASSQNKYNQKPVSDIKQGIMNDNGLALITSGRRHQLLPLLKTHSFVYNLNLYFETTGAPQAVSLFLSINSNSKQTSINRVMLLLFSSLLVGFVLFFFFYYFVIQVRLLKPIHLIMSSITQSKMLSEEELEKMHGHGELERLSQNYNFLMEELDNNHQEIVLEKSKSEAALQAKSEFLAVMTHEIRTPLNGIVGCVELVNETELNERQSEYMNLIGSASEQLMTLVNDVLDLSKIESGNMTLDIHSVELITILKGTLQIFDVGANRSNIPITFSSELPDNYYVGVDSVRIKQIVVNLLDNALKFTSEGEIKVELSLLEKKETYDELRLSISDTGIGLSQEQIGRIFGKFSQADSSTTRKYGGTGLGLSICDQLVTLMNGELKVTSTLGVGSCFYFNFDAEHRSREINEVAQKTQDNWIPAATLKLLIVDDTEANLIIARCMFERENIQITTIQSGKEAIEACKVIEYDLILLDCQMPDIDGYECAREIRNNEQQHRNLIIAFTASALKETEEQCREAGMDDFLVKPLTTSKVDSIYQILKTRLSEAGESISD